MLLSLHKANKEMAGLLKQGGQGGEWAGSHLKAFFFFFVCFTVWVFWGVCFIGWFCCVRAKDVRGWLAASKNLELELVPFGILKLQLAPSGFLRWGRCHLGYLSWGLDQPQ